MEKSKKKDEPDGGLIPQSIVSLMDLLADNMIRTLPIELLDETVEILLRKINKRVIAQHGHGLFAAYFLMETREKIINMEGEGQYRCEPNMQHRLPEFNHFNMEAYNEH